MSVFFASAGTASRMYALSRSLSSALACVFPPTQAEANGTTPRAAMRTRVRTGPPLRFGGQSPTTAPPHLRRQGEITQPPYAAPLSCFSEGRAPDLVRARARRGLAPVLLPRFLLALALRLL